MFRKHTLLILAIGLLASSKGMAQSSSNTCAGMTNIHTFSVGTTCNLQSFNKSPNFTATQAATGCGAGGFVDAWGQFVANHNKTFLRYSTTNGNAVLTVYTGTCGALTQVACVNSFAGGAEEEKLILSTTPGTNYIIRLEHVGANTAITGKLCLVKFDNPANDECAAAPTIGRGVTAFSTYGATGTDITSCAAGDSKDVWFRYVSACTGTATVSTCGTADFNSALAIFSACGGTQLACNANGSGCPGGLSKVSFPVVTGTAYLVRVSGEDAGMGAGTLDIACEVTADFCATASPISDGQSDYRSTAATGTDITSCGLNDSKDIWMKYTASCAGEVNISNCGTAGFNTTLAAFGSCGGAEIACNDDAVGCGQASSITFRALPGMQFMIRLAGVGGVKGFGSLTTTCSPIIYYSRGSGRPSDPIWSRTPNGPAGMAEWSNYTNMTVQGGHTITQSTATITFRDLKVAGGGTYIIPGTNELTVLGNVDVQGTISSSTGSIRFAGTTQQIIRSNPAGPFYNITQDNAAGILVDSDIAIKGTLSLLRGPFVATGRDVRMASDASGTGRLGPVAPAASYVGNLTMERYVPAGNTNWRLLGSSVANATVLDWKDNFYMAGFPGSHSPGFSNPTGSGILWPSVRYYRESDVSPNMNVGLVGVPSTSQKLTPGRGYAVWSGTGFNTTTAFKIDVSGIPNIANAPIVLPMTYTNTGSPAADGWNLVSNPLPSPIRFDQLLRGADVAEYVVYFDPRTGNNATYDIRLGAGTNGATNMIQSGQGFWMKANGPAVTTTVSESAKAVGNTGGFFGQQVPNTAILRMRISSTMNQFSDEALVVFTEGTPGIDGDDVPKFVFAHPQAPQIASHADGTVLLAINAYGQYSTNISIPVAVNVAVNGTYNLSITGLDGIGLSCLRLEDRLTGTFTPIEEGTSYSFNAQTSANATASSNTRFMLHGSAPVVLDAVKATCAGRDDGQASVTIANGPVDVSWMNEDEVSILEQYAVGAGTSSIMALAAGDYYVQVSSSAGCGALASAFTIEEPTQIVIDGTTEPATCPGSEDGSMEVYVSGGDAPYTYQWSNGTTMSSIDAIQAGTYQVVVTDANGCVMAPQEYVVGEGEGPSVGIELATSTVTVGAEVQFYTGSDLSAGHLWEFGDGATSNELEPVHIYESPGDYVVSLTVDDGTCTSSTAVALTVDGSTALPTIVGPTYNAWVSGNVFVIDHNFNNMKPVTVRILTTNGKLVQEHRFAGTPARITLPTDELANGIWLLRVSNGNSMRTFSLPVMR